MRIRLIAVGTRMPAWVQDGFRDYATRMPPECRLELTEIPLGRRGKNTDPLRARMQEGERMLTALDRDCRVIALDVQGRPWDTPKLAERLGDWLQGGRDIALLVGGPDGLSSDCLARADERWSLSPLTLPHAMVRVIVAEALYRAWSIRANHPYHRA